ncbi:MAG TPA: methyltransferase domain-containing protein [bacterium]
MSDKYGSFYEMAGRYYPEDEITYSSLSGIIRKKWVLNKINTMPAGCLLDCGCNIGRLGSHWERGAIFGVDISLSLLRVGKRAFPLVNFVNGDARNLDFLKPMTMDSAIVIEVIEHLDRPREFLKGLYKAMKHGGEVLVTCPGYSRTRPKYLELGIVRSFGIRKGPDGTGDRYLHTAYKPGELASMAKQAGFAVKESGGFEHEMRVWNRLLVMLSNMAAFLGTKLFPYSKLNYLLLRAIHKLELNIFQALDVFGFSRFLRILFKEGRRTYVLLQKI